MIPHRLSIQSSLFAFLCSVIVLMVVGRPTWGEPLSVRLSYQRETSSKSGRFHRLQRQESWEAEQTAVIVCDVWDLHHCLNAVRRVGELAPRINEVLKAAREKGATIIHAPSDCMPAYAEHPSRQRATGLAATGAVDVPTEAADWCSTIPAEEMARYPIDQTDGGEDDDPVEHAEWVAQLEAMGRNPATPWLRQNAAIEIDAEHDYVSDRGDEVFRILEHHGIRNVILTGVHTNMCVLGRPFGLRQMVR